MARSVDTIRQGMLLSISADPILSTVLTSTSLMAIYRLWVTIVAISTNLLEQVWDGYLAALQLYASQSPAATGIWIQSQVFKYQYDPSGIAATNALTILSNGALAYATVNPVFNIVTQCSVITSGNNIVLVKAVQGGTSPTPITGTAFTQLDSYLTSKMPAGVNHLLSSLAADNVVILGTIYFKNGYGGIILANVMASLNSYLNTIGISQVLNNTKDVNYQGILKVDDVIAAVRNTDGVDDFRLSTIKCYAASSNFPFADIVYDLATGVNIRNYTMLAGYGVMDYTHSVLTITPA